MFAAVASNRIAKETPLQLVRYRMKIHYGRGADDQKILWEGADLLSLSHRFRRCCDAEMIGSRNGLGYPYISFECLWGNGGWKMCFDPRLYIFSIEEYGNLMNDTYKRIWMRLFSWCCGAFVVAIAGYALARFLF